MCIAKDHPRLSLRRQCRLLSLSRSVLYYTPVGESAENLAFDRQFLETPWYGSRQMARWLRRQGHAAGRHRVRRLMRKMRLVPIYQPPRTSQPHPQHKVYPYLLKGLEITRPPLPRRDHGLGDAKGAGVAAVEHDGGGLLC
jgi:putative transposase